MKANDKTIYTVIRRGGDVQRDTFDNLAADYDFTGMETVDLILDLPVAGEMTDGYALWIRETE